MHDLAKRSHELCVAGGVGARDVNDNGRITILAISHQRALVASADRVYRLEKGSAVLDGWRC